MTEELLIVDDNERVFRSLAINFRKDGFVCHWAKDSESAIQAARDHRLSAAIIDLSLGSESGLDVMRALQDERADVPVVFISGFGTLEAAVAAMKLGAFDFLPKPLDFAKLHAVVRDAIDSRRGVGSGRGESSSRSGQPAGETFGAAIVHADPVMETLLRQAANAAVSDIPVLITGESGTGKELVAEYIHVHSPRGAKPLVRVNCSAIVDSLAESELFGHVKGSFTGADTDHTGFFEQADGGTLHLDEIGDMPLPTQAKILRTLENAVVRRVGGRHDIGVDVRIVASTNKNLADLVRDGQFRNDLLYRINALHLAIPPLRERRDDIPVLIRHYLREAAEEGQAKRFSLEAERLLLQYDWPGNVRELKNTVRVSALLTPGSIIEAGDLPRAVTQPVESGVGMPEHPGVASQSGRLQDVEKSALMRVLQEVGGNRRKAAERLGISVRSLYYKLERHGLS